jgi:hypothetical protein
MDEDQGCGKAPIPNFDDLIIAKRIEETFSHIDFAIDRTMVADLSFASNRLIMR